MHLHACAGLRTPADRFAAARGFRRLAAGSLRALAPLPGAPEAARAAVSVAAAEVRGAGWVGSAGARDGGSTRRGGTLSRVPECDHGCGGDGLRRTGTTGR